MQKISRTLNISSLQSQKPSIVVMKLVLMSTATEDKLPASESAAQINASQSSSNRHISTSTVQLRLRESGLYGQIDEK
jgi:hypothetical protein